MDKYLAFNVANLTILTFNHKSVVREIARIA